MVTQRLGGGLSSGSEKEKKDTGERLSSMPPLSLPSGENERGGGLSLFKMHKTQHPAVAWLPHHSKRQAQGKLSGSSYIREGCWPYHTNQTLNATLKLCTWIISALF